MRTFGLLGAAVLAVSAGAAAQTRGMLAVRAPIAGTLGAGEAHAYALDLAAGDLARGDATGPDVDLVVRAVGPDGQTIRVFDTGARGAEPFAFFAPTAGTYQIIVSPFQQESGAYALTLYRAAPPATDARGRLEESLDFYGGPGRPGAVLLILDGGRVAETIARGLGADGAPAGPDTRYDAGAVGESMTAAAALTLARDGRLDLQAPITRYLPGLVGADDVPVWALVQHRTRFLDAEAIARLRGWTPREPLLQSAADSALVLQARLGARRGYESTGRTDGMLLARVIEAVTGEPFAGWMRRTLFVPLGMRRTVVRTAPGPAVPDLAPGYGSRATAGLALTGPNRDGTYGWGNVVTTPADLARWVVAFAGGRPRVVAPWQPPGAETYRAVWTSGATAIPVQGGFRIASRGGADGYSASFQYDPAARRGYVLMTNADASASPPVASLAEVVFPGIPAVYPPPPGPGPPPPPAPRPPSREEVAARLDAFVGRYENAALGVTYVVTREPDALGRDRLIARGPAGAETLGDDSERAFWSNGLLGHISFETEPEPAFVLSRGALDGLRFTKTD